MDKVVIGLFTSNQVLLNSEGERLVFCLKIREKYELSSNPNRKAISFTDKSVK